MPNSVIKTYLQAIESKQIACGAGKPRVADELLAVTVSQLIHETSLNS